MSPDPLRVLVSAVLSQDILAMVTDLVSVPMDMALDVSALGLVFTQLDLSMNPDLPRVLVSAVLMPSQATTLKTTGHQ